MKRILIALVVLSGCAVPPPPELTREEVQAEFQKVADEFRKRDEVMIKIGKAVNALQEAKKK